MIFNDISFPSINGLNHINELINTDIGMNYLALIQIDDIIDYYLIPDTRQDTLNQLAYYLFIAYDIQEFNDDNIKLIKLIPDKLLLSHCIDLMNAYNNNLINDSMHSRY